jgi:hypothetical protein
VGLADYQCRGCNLSIFPVARYGWGLIDGNESLCSFEYDSGYNDYGKQNENAACYLDFSESFACDFPLAVPMFMLSIACIEPVICIMVFF